MKEIFKIIIIIAIIFVIVYFVVSTFSFEGYCKIVPIGNAPGACFQYYKLETNPHD